MPLRVAAFGLFTEGSLLLMVRRGLVRGVRAYATLGLEKHADRAPLSPSCGIGGRGISVERRALGQTAGRHDPRRAKHYCGSRTDRAHLPVRQRLCGGRRCRAPQPRRRWHLDQWRIHADEARLCLLGGDNQRAANCRRRQYLHQAGRGERTVHQHRRHADRLRAFALLARRPGDGVSRRDPSFACKRQRALPGPAPARC